MHPLTGLALLSLNGADDCVVFIETQSKGISFQALAYNAHWRSRIRI